MAALLTRLIKAASIFQRCLAVVLRIFILLQLLPIITIDTAHAGHLVTLCVVHRYVDVI